MANEEKNKQEIDLSILLPTYNESTIIEKMLGAITEIIPSKINTEILVLQILCRGLIIVGKNRPKY